MPYWANQYDTAFHGPLLAQQQILAEAQQALLGAGHGENIELVERICRGFSEFLYPLANRQRGRPPISNRSGTTLQDFFHGLYRIFFDDVRPARPPRRRTSTPAESRSSRSMTFVIRMGRIWHKAGSTRSACSVRWDTLGLRSRWISTSTSSRPPDGANRSASISSRRLKGSCATKSDQI